MFKWLLKNFIGTKNQRDLKNIQPQIDKINELELEYQQLSDEELRAKTDEFRNRLKEGETCDDILCEAFATVKNACRRLVGSKHSVCESEITWDMIPYDVQLVGGIVLHQHKIAEMATGEGKTLVATMPLYLNALSGKGAHLVTVNDYLARRDAEWMGTVYRWLGLTVGCLQNQMPSEKRKEQYNCDVTYGTNSEFGFDYLRDNTARQAENIVQKRGHHYAIIDEIDSVLIDEARTPLIISGPAPQSSTKQYQTLNSTVRQLVRKQHSLCNKLVRKASKLLEEGQEAEAQRHLYQLRNGMPKNKELLRMLEDSHIRKLVEKVEDMMLTDMHKEESRELREELFFNIDEKGHDAHLTDRGRAALNPDNPEEYTMPNLVDMIAELENNEELSNQEKIEKRQEAQEQFSRRSERIHAIDQLIRAYAIYERDVEYVVKNNRVMIVDQNTGRLMPGRRWSDGLHMAVEAKEGVKVERETQTLASITIQNYFRMYDKLGGMTGTAETEAEEFHETYDLDVIVIPTNRPVRRVDQNDVIYKTKREKFNALIEEIGECHRRKQPVLVGTISVDTSEKISKLLKRKKLPHNVLNAKNHMREAEIVSFAGQPGAITIATNMAGRGTDIKLGEGVVKIPREVICSDKDLKDKFDGETLKDEIINNPNGLYVIASERHESRRIDRQLRGRCARQGDPGMSRFYVSLEDDLMRLFGSEKISKIMDRLGIEEGEVLEHPLLNRSLGKAQKRVEQYNFSMRKRTLEYDDVMNKQREVIYELRRRVLLEEDTTNLLYDFAADAIQDQAELVADMKSEEVRKEFVDWLNMTFPIGVRLGDISAEDSAEETTNKILERVKRAYTLKIRNEKAEALNHLERTIMLSTVDERWQEYLRHMDGLKEGIGLRAYGQRDPLLEYKKEAYGMFSELMDDIKKGIGKQMFRMSTSYEAMETFLKELPQMYVHNETKALGPNAQPQGNAPPAGGAGQAPNQKSQPLRKTGPKVGRNDPCPCGSGKKYKKCCGR